MDARTTIDRRVLGQNPRLQRIADLTGMPLSAFLLEDDAARQPSLADLIRLWDAIGDDAGRAEVLACARAKVGTAAGSAG